MTQKTAQECFHDFLRRMLGEYAGELEQCEQTMVVAGARKEFAESREFSLNGWSRMKPNRLIDSLEWRAKFVERRAAEIDGSPERKLLLIGRATALREIAARIRGYADGRKKSEKTKAVNQ